MNDATQEALMLCVAPEPGKDPVIRVFETWPREWDAAFQLLAKGGFLVTSRLHNRRIQFVEIRSQFGGKCRIRNPWPGNEVLLTRNGKCEGSIGRPLLSFDTNHVDTVVLSPPKKSLDDLKAAIRHVPHEFSKTVPITAETDSNELDMTGWTAKSSYQNDWKGWEPERVLDGFGHGWTSGEPMRKGGWFMIDMKKEHKIGALEMSRAHYSWGGVRKFSVFLSSDGKAWGSPVAGGREGQVVKVTFAQRRARYIKIEDTLGVGNTSWWYIQYIKVWGEA